MIINGVSINTPLTKKFYFNYNGTPLEIQAKAVTDYTDFDAVCPKPVPEVRHIPKENRNEIMDKEPVYLTALSEWLNRRSDWMILTSISATEVLKFETVDMKNPSTYGNWAKEITDSGLPEQLANEIYSLVSEVNLLSSDKLEEARKHFLALRANPVAPKNYQTTEQFNTVSTELASDSESSHPE